MRGIGALAVIALHAVALGTLLAYEPARSSLFSAAPIMVQWIAPPRAEPPVIEPRIEPPRPKPAARRAPRAPQPRSILAVPVEAPSPVVAPPQLAITAPPAPPAPAPVTSPVFDADYLLNPAPAYPALSRRLGEQGRVVLRVLVNAHGGADEVLVRTSSGHARLDDTARDTVRRWRFVPARRGDQPVAAWVLIPISFRLEG